MEEKYTLILVPQTHWDREWYGTFQVFRMRLVKLTDKLLRILDTDPAYKSFTFDGQTVVLEDYLEIRPEERERLKQHIQADRILVGPWYILPDEFLVSGEATVRNLMIGHMIAGDFGRPMKAGYIPDPFGHISQLPQILRGFGIDSCIFTRGLGDEWEGMATEFNWEAADGTPVLAIYQLHGYCNACNLGYVHDPEVGFKVDFDAALDHVKREMETLGEKASTRFLLLNNGCDHLEPQPELPEIVRYINERLEHGEVVHSTYEDFVARVKAEKPKLGTLKGELHSGKYHPLLPGVFSARMCIKQANERTQTLLEKWAEPTSALAWMLGGNYERAFLWEAWKLCIKNHPHDSICGCSVDQVHREMMPRFEQSQQIGGRLTDENLEYIAGKIDTQFGPADQEVSALIAFNALNYELDGLATYRMRATRAVGELPDWPVVRDPSGKAVPSQVSSRITTEYYDGIPSDKQSHEYDLTFAVSKMPGLGYRAYSIEMTAERPSYISMLGTAGTSVENALIRVDVNPNGSFNLTDKRTGRVYEGCNLFEDTEDAGDEYNYSPAFSSKTITTAGSSARITVVDDGPLFARFRVDLDLMLPESLTDDRMTRSERLVLCPVTSFITVYASSPRVDVKTRFTNNAKDHRFRALFPTSTLAAVHHAEGQFDVVERQNELPGAKGWVEKPVGTNAQQSFVDVSDGQAGLAVINQGLPEYEVMEDARGNVIALTLLRCVGWLSRDDYITRPYNAGPKIPTPDAQCAGTWEFSYAVLPHVGSWEEAKVWEQAHLHDVPFRLVRTGLHSGKLPKEAALVTVAGDGLVVSTLKKAENADALIVRLYNTTSSDKEGTVSCLKPIKEIVPTNLNEEPEGRPLKLKDNKAAVEVPPFRIVTLRVTV